MENEAKKEEAKELQEDDDEEQYDTIPKIKLVYEVIRVKEFRVRENLNGVNTRIITGNLTPHIEMRAKVIN